MFALSVTRHPPSSCPTFQLRATAALPQLFKNTRWLLPVLHHVIGYSRLANVAAQATCAVRCSCGCYSSRRRPKQLGGSVRGAARQCAVLHQERRARLDRCKFLLLRNSRRFTFTPLVLWLACRQHHSLQRPRRRHAVHPPCATPRAAQLSFAPPQVFVQTRVRLDVFRNATVLQRRASRRARSSRRHSHGHWFLRPGERFRHCNIVTI